MADEVNENIFLVNAPAGSGKTTWIRQQVESYLLRNPKESKIQRKEKRRFRRLMLVPMK